MEALIRFLLLVLIVISALSGIMTIIFGWKRFSGLVLMSFLKKITIPVYIYLIIIFVVVLAIIFWPATKDHPKELKTIKGESFGVQRIFVDGKHFVNCKFDGTELAYKGEGDCRLDNCSFIKPRLMFDGAASDTINSLKSLYATPEFRPQIEETFKDIRKGELQIATPPSDAADG